MTDYVRGLRLAADWLENLDLPPAVVSPAKSANDLAITLFWHLVWQPDDFAVAQRIVRACEHTGVVGWRKYEIDNKVTLMAIERTIPAGIYITCRATDKPAGGIPRDFTQMGVQFL